MNPIIFLSFAISCFALSKADPYEVGYSLALGPLEFFLKQEKEEVSHCYKENKDPYENSVVVFLKKIIEMEEKLHDAFPIPSKSRDAITWGMNEMKNIGDGLNNFFGELKKNIFNGKLIEGGKTIFNQRNKAGNHYAMYTKHGDYLTYLNENHYTSHFSPMNNAFKEILQKSKELVDAILDCLAKKNVTYKK